MELLFSASYVQAQVLEREAGVEIGDVIKYGDFSAQWGSEKPGATPELDLLETNNTLSVTNTVLNVVGTNVTFQGETRYKNGSLATTEVCWVDVATGTGSGNLSFVPAGLGVGDRVHTLGELYAARINSTALRSYAGLMRQTNLMNLSDVSIDLESTRAVVSEFYWDKVTGVMVEQFWSYAAIDDQGYLTVASVEYKMVDNNIWIGEDVSDMIPPVAVAGSNSVVQADANVTFDGNGSYDDIGIARLVWNFGDGASSVGVQVFHVFGNAGVYDVTLTVEDGAGHTSSDVLVVTVEGVDSPPPVSGLLAFIMVVVLVVLVLAWFLLKRR